MSISPPSSPASGVNGSSSPILSPRSKVKALLTGLDDDSESDISEHEVKLSSSRDSDLSIRRSCLKPAHPVDPGSEDSDEDEPIIPRGRIAGRLQGRAIDELGAVSSQDEVLGETARDRTKRRLMKKVAPYAKSSSEDTRSEATSGKPSVFSEAQFREPESSAERIEGHDSPIIHAETFLRSPTAAVRSPIPSPSERHIGASTSKILPVNSRVQGLVARKSAERKSLAAKEEAEKEKNRSMILQSGLFESSDEDSEREVRAGKNLTQHARPTRKASKRAIEEMNRETQRLSRNRQLAHEARTTKKISKQSFLDRFNYRTSSIPATTNLHPVSSTTPTSAPASEGEDDHHRSSPLTSPASPNDPIIKTFPMIRSTGQVENSTEPKTVENVPKLDEIPTQATLLNTTIASSDQSELFSTDKPALPSSIPAKFRTPIRERLARQSMRLRTRVEESDSDIVIEPLQKSRARLDKFQSKKQAKIGGGDSLQTLRALAHVNSSPVKKSNRSSKSSISLSELQASLQRQARQQAAHERAEKIRELKDKGVIIQTVEERTRDQAEVEDLLERAQKEAAGIREKEKRKAKKHGAAAGNVEDGLSDTSDEDDDYEGSQGSDADLELSGSEEEVDDSDDECHKQSQAGNENALDKTEGLIANEASEDEQNEEEIGVGDAIDKFDEDIGHAEDEDETASLPVPHRKIRNKVILDDDEDEDDHSDQSPSTMLQSLPLQNPFQAVAVNPLKPAAGMLGLTQAFAATMANSQTQQPDSQSIDELDMVGLLGTMPEPDLPLYDPEMVEDSQIVTDVLLDQSASLPAEVRLDFTQSQIMREGTEDQLSATQDMDLPDPSQDVGFALSSPAGKRFVSPVPSTIDTVLLSPSVVPKGRLRRGANAPIDKIDKEGDDSVQVPKNADQVPANAFDILKKRLSKPEAESKYDKRTTKAKEMVEEQAQESEDEYAGIGGASDDESGDENDEEVQKMIDESSIRVDEQELAALHA